MTPEASIQLVEFLEHVKTHVMLFKSFSLDILVTLLDWCFMIGLCEVPI